MTIKKAIAATKSRLANGMSLDDAIRQLRADGLSKVKSMHVVSQAAEMDPVKAKFAVHASPAWSDRAAGDEAFQEKLEGAASDLLDEE
jgi:hypothetical protein